MKMKSSKTLLSSSCYQTGLAWGTSALVRRVQDVGQNNDLQDSNLVVECGRSGRGRRDGQAGGFRLRCYTG